MKFNYPSHLLLDIKTSHLKYTNSYWLFQYVKTFKKEGYFNTTLNFINNPTSPLLKNSHLLTDNTVHFVNSNSWSCKKQNSSVNLSLRNKKLVEAKKTFLNNTSRVDKLAQSKDFTPFNLYQYNHDLGASTNLNQVMSTSLTHLLFDINFLKKERLYTKLKYSRSPAYDIVSGGAAALLSAFIGFLISEKFGIELVDSGDFYIVWMYIVFIALAVRPFLKISDVRQQGWSIFSLNHALDFFQTFFFFASRTFFKYIVVVISFVTRIWTRMTSLNLISAVIILLFF